MNFTEDADVETFDVNQLSPGVLENVEADSFWCLSRLLDGIQVRSYNESPYQSNWMLIESIDACRIIIPKANQVSLTR